MAPKKDSAKDMETEMEELRKQLQVAEVAAAKAEGMAVQAAKEKDAAILQTRDLVSKATEEKQLLERDAAAAKQALEEAKRVANEVGEVAAQEGRRATEAEKALYEARGRAQQAEGEAALSTSCMTPSSLATKAGLVCEA